MSHGTDLVLRGPPVGPIPECSLGEYVIGKMRSLPQDRIVQVEAETGAKQTVGELLEMGARVSEGLRKMGLKEGDVVMMLCRTSLDTTAIVLGSWLSAGVIMPLPTELKVGEIKYALDMAEPKFIFCEEEAAENVAAAVGLLSASPTVILLPDSSDKQQRPSGVRATWKLFRDVLPEVDVASYVPQPVKSPSTELVGILFSSGTSGLPKGVGITHRNLIFQDVNMDTVAQPEDDFSFLHLSQFFWITAHLFFLRTVTAGLKRVLLARPTEINVLKAIEKYKVVDAPHPGANWTMTAPLFGLSILNHPDFEKYDVSSMRVFIVGGSVFTPSMGEKFKEKWKTVMVLQSYGTTETTGPICSTTFETDPFSLGRVVAGVDVKIVDFETGKPLQANASGEIWVKSPGVMWGYVKNEEASREALDNEGWFRTGDVGYYDESKQVFLVERLKEVIKITSMQVAPAEVENVVLSVPGVLEAFVTGVVDKENVYHLVGLVVKKKDSDVTAKVIQDRVAGILSEYKQLKGGVIFLESLPKTGTGKLKRGELRKMAQELYSNGQYRG